MIKDVFFGVMLSILILKKYIQKELHKTIKNLLMILIMTEFPVDKEDFGKTETKKNICINVYCYENKLIFSIHISDEKCENAMDLLLVTDENKSHYVYIKDFDRFVFHKTKNKKKKYFSKSCLQCFTCKNVMTEHKEVCLSINGSQSVRLEKGTIEFKNHFKQIPVSFKTYADFKCNLVI